jgi:hypothetical protein
VCGYAHGINATGGGKPEQAERGIVEKAAAVVSSRKREARVSRAILMPIKRFAFILGAMALSSLAFAAGIDSRTYTCAALQNLVAAQRFVFINNPNFEDFVVANVSYCGGGGSAVLQRRSVPTTDNPECPVNYCRISEGDWSSD